MLPRAAQSISPRHPWTARRPAPCRDPRRRPLSPLVQFLESRIHLTGTVPVNTLAAFNNTNGNDPGPLVQDAAGNLYGVTFAGGTTNLGTVFEMAQGSNTITNLASFTGDNGFHPLGNVVLDPAGNIFGTASVGGANNDGVVFEVVKGSGTITDLASFDGVHGATPVGLIRDSNGNLLGTTSAGGASQNGTLFEVASGSHTITDLADFNAAVGISPNGPLIADATGNLYGTTIQGGAHSLGTVFEVSGPAHTITDLASFDGSNGQNPTGPLTLDAAGNLYGEMTGGGTANAGGVFKLLHGSATITALAFFDNTNGANPAGGLLLDGAGNLYGTTSSNGAHFGGTLFEIPNGSSTINVLVSFDGDNGSNPQGGVIVDASGNFFGTTAAGGASGAGTIFELPVGGGPLTELAFMGIANSGPVGPLVLDGNGNLYGVTSIGGINNTGTVFEVPAGSGTVTTLASFNGTDGESPNSLIIDANGNLYGTTTLGGPDYTPIINHFGFGTVFEVVKGSGTITDLAAFDGTNGSGPVGPLVRDANGNLYGATAGGGLNQQGAVFEIANGQSTITDLASFTGLNGSAPAGGLIMDSRGNLYGTTNAGGPGFNPGANQSGVGTVFEIVANSGAITDLATFNGANGAFPSGDLTMDAAGNLYGATQRGGPGYNADTGQTLYGTIFEIASGSGTITTLGVFNNDDGSVPNGGLLLDDAGNLYGSAQFGGASNLGTLFEVVKGSGTITQLFSFNGDNGSNPGSLTSGGQGKFYGATSAGGDLDLTMGNYGDGTVFAFTLPGASIVGTSGNDAIHLVQDTDHLRIDWTSGSQSGKVLIADPNGLTIVGNGGTDTITLDSANGNPLPSALKLSGTFTIIGALTMTASQKIDLETGSAAFTYTGPTPLASIQGYLKSGQILSSHAAPGMAVADIDSGTAVTLKVDHLGDVNGSGKVDFADLLALAQNYNRTGADWSKGDFNYDGKVDFSDLLILAQNYNQVAATTAPLADSIVETTATLKRSIRSRRRPVVGV